MSDEFDDEGGGGESEHEVMFDEETMGVLVAGRTVDSGDLTRADIGKLFTAIEALGQKKGLALTLVPSGDLTDTGPGPDEECYSTMAIGLSVFSGGTYGPEKVPTDAITAKLNAAKAIGQDVWQEVANLLPEGAREDFLSQDVGLDLVCVGPLAAAYLAFGQEGSEEDGGEGEFIHGQDMGQEPHEVGVWGQEVVSCEFEGSGHERVDFSEGAHQARVAAHPGGEYYVIARYD